MEEFLKILIDEIDREERSYWYVSGYDIEAAALNVMGKVIDSALRRFKEES